MPNEHGLSGMLREHGCPMMDDTSWHQTESGDTFTSPEGIGTAAFWLPCVSMSAGPTLPGMCADCASHPTGLQPEGEPLSV
jgi:hypothetical protein